MLPLNCPATPSTPSELQSALESALRDLFSSPPTAAAPVAVAGSSLDAVETLRIDATGAHVDLQRQPPVPAAARERKPLARILSLEIEAQPLKAGSRAGLSFTVKGSRLAAGEVLDENGRRWMSITAADHGEARMEIRRDDLRQLILEVGRPAVEQHGATLEDVQLDLRQVDAQTAEMRAEISVRKFLRATLNVSGRIELTPEMEVTLRNLRCDGGGGLGAMIGSVVQPRLSKFEGRTFSLPGLGFEDLRLQQVELDVRDPEVLKAGARFGRA